MEAFADWKLDFSSGIPVYKQIQNLFFFEIGRGTLREGDRLPTIKELADHFQKEMKRRRDAGKSF